MAAEGNDPLMKMAISATQLTLFFAIFLRYFSRPHRTNFSQIPQDLSLSCELVFLGGAQVAAQSGPSLGCVSRSAQRPNRQVASSVSRIDDLIGIWSMPPKPGTVAGKAWDPIDALERRGARPAFSLKDGVDSTSWAAARRLVSPH